MSRQTDDGHEGWIAPVFADGMYGSIWSGAGVGVTHRADGTIVPSAEQQFRPDSEVTGWRVQCDDLNNHGRQCWRGQFWTRVTDPFEHNPEQRRIFAEDALLTTADEDLMMREWEAHIAPTRGTAEVRWAADEVAAAQRRLTEAVLSAREQGASWEGIGQAARMTRQSAHERWSAVSTR
ncbi:hypothetical protein ACTD5D_41060 [Nocardia takedensis]|uniref:hypothetical protein n=1 Tax=Nocardia takedensis TaxID=259390 RepID=UPI003F77653E